MVKNLLVMQETWVQSLGWEDPLEKAMATHSSILAWRIPWTEEPHELQPMGSQTDMAEWLTLSVCPHLISDEFEVQIQTLWLCFSCCLLAQSLLTVCNPMDCSWPGSTVYGISQARILVWVGMSPSRGSFQPRNWTRVSCIGRHFFFFFNHWGIREALCSLHSSYKPGILPLNAAVQNLGRNRGRRDGSTSLHYPFWFPEASRNITVLPKESDPPSGE